ncbi:hypothetical protein COCON_G00043150 [Conger conger]|uniref:Uncharacterized protein n=1 Tax=Conger conger TaxID=82655 RepID=A0A9Q1DU46_CONCO|nr:hypothetical protein COCON_G00043150 [Conger conger]
MGEISPTASQEGDCKRSGYPASVSTLHLWALGGLIVILLIVIVILICRSAVTGKKSQDNSDGNQAQDPDTLNYAALNFTQKKQKTRRRENLEPHVVYAATR